MLNFTPAACENFPKLATETTLTGPPQVQWLGNSRAFKQQDES